jgi:hypothetical protein
VLQRAPPGALLLLALLLPAGAALAPQLLWIFQDILAVEAAVLQ